MSAAARRTVLLVGADSPVRTAYALLIEMLGATVLCRLPGEPVGDEPGVLAAVALGDDLAARARGVELAGELAALRRWPLLLVGIGRSAEVLDALAEVTGVRLSAAARGEAASFRFAPAEPMLWPFAGLTLSEQRPRAVTPLVGEDHALRPLVSAAGGPVVAAVAAHGQRVVVSTASGWPDGPPPVLWRSFRPESFLDTLPVLAFTREVLAGRGWARPSRQATCIVDDPNLRRLRYGHLDFRAALRFCRERPFHLAVGFVPLDYATTSEPVARLFREHAGDLSLLIHGNDHLRLELSRPAPDAVALRSVAQALARMRRHGELTGIACPAVMTPPHGACSPGWARALQAAGYAAVVATAVHPFTDRPEAEGAGPFHELHCADLGLAGFPVIIRYPLTSPRERWLFAAWLGKPLVIYAHHGDFAGDASELRGRVDFINDRLAPRWCGLDDIVHDNHEVRLDGAVAEVRVFSNDVVVRVPDGVAEVLVAKEGQDIPWRTETVLVDGRPVSDGERSSTALRVRLDPAGRRQLNVRFVPGSPPAEPRLEVDPRSRARRILTEARDRLSAVR